MPDTPFAYWIQHADFSTTDGGAVTLPEAMRIFHAHDWTAEMDRARAMIAAEAGDVCPPGIGFLVDDPASDLLLHICPMSWETVDVHYSHPVAMKRLFGLLPATQTVGTTSKAGIQITDVGRLVTLFFAGRDSELRVVLQK
jgi:hypothetical protein